MAAKVTINTGTDQKVSVSGQQNNQQVRTVGVPGTDQRVSVSGQATTTQVRSVGVQGASENYGPVSDQSNTAIIIANQALAAAQSAVATADAISASANIIPTFMQANLAYDAANAAQLTANTAYLFANNAYIASNVSLILANGAYIYANSAYEAAAAAFDKANAANLLAFTSNVTSLALGATAYGQANLARSDANTAFTHANNSYNFSNTVLVTAQGAFSQANAAPGIANSYATSIGVSSNAYATAVGVAGNSVAIAVGTSGNTYAASVGVGANTYTLAAFGQANAAFATASAAFDKANGSTQLAFYRVNTAANNLTSTSNADTLLVRGGGNIRVVGNTANLMLSIYDDQTTLIAAFTQANAAPGIANSYATAVGVAGNSVAVSVGTSGNTYAASVGVGANTYTLAAFDQANTAYNHGNNAYNFANTVLVTAIGAFTQANSAPGIANSYAAAVGTSSNSYATAVGVAGNSVAVSIGTSGNTYAASVGVGANTYATAVGAAGNVYAASVGVGANSYTLAAFDQANTAITDANQAGVQANNAYGRANVANNLVVAQDGTIIGARNILNFNTGSNTSLSITDDSSGNRINVTISSQGSGGGGSTNLVSVFEQANTALITAQASYAQGNAQLAFYRVNTAANNLTATSNADTLIVRGGGNIVVTGNTANLTLSIHDDQTTLIAAFAQANAAPGIANSYATAVGVAGNSVSVSIGTAGNVYAASVGVGANIYALAAFQKANTASLEAGGAHSTANAAMAAAGAAFDGANTAFTQGNNAYNFANTVLITAQGAFDKANTSGAAELAFYRVNTAANNLTATSNADTLIVRGGGNIQVVGNTANMVMTIYDDQTTLIAAFNQANAAPGIANSYATAVGVAGNSVAVAVGTAGNVFAASVGVGANTYTLAAFDQANTAITDANQAGTNANNAYGQANSAIITAQGAFDKANGSTQLAFYRVNTAANNLTATSNADTLIVRGGGNIIVTGNTANMVLSIHDDPTTLIAAFGQANAAPGIANSYAVLVGAAGNVYAASVGVGANTYTLAAFDAANTAYTQANNAYNFANTVLITAVAAFDQANTAGSPGGSQNTFFQVNTAANNLTATSNADTLIVRGGGNIIVTGNTANLTLSIHDDQTTLISAYAQANAAPGIANTYATAVGVAGNSVSVAVGTAGNTYAASVGTGANTYANTSTSMAAVDIRRLSPSNNTVRRVQAGFGSWNNDGGAPYADFMHLRSYSDASGGNDNLISVRKDGTIGMRVWTQTFGSTNAYGVGASTSKDVAFTSDLTTKANLASPTFTGTVTIPTPFTLGGVSVTSTAAELNILDGVTATAAELNALDGITATVTELNYTDGVTSAIQTQLDAKLASASYTAADVLAKLLTVDGAGSGVDADLLDGISSASFMQLAGAQTATGRKTFGAGGHGNSAIATASGSLGEIEIYGNGTGAAAMTFHRPGAYAAYFGIDTDNVWKVGGWSMGAASYTLWHSGNDGAGSGLDADLLDGQSSAYYLAASSYTAADVLTKIKTVDGAGSGLDADLLDGTSSAAFVSGGVNKKSTSSASMNDLTVPSGFYFYSAATGAPTAEWYNWMTVMGDWWNSSDNYGFQLAHNFWNTDLYVRRVQTGAWQSWNKIWHAGNDGSGSGLDADLLDGMNADVNVTGSTIVARHAAGYVFGNYFNMTADVTTGTASHIAVATSSDNYLRWQTPAQFITNNQLDMVLLGTITTTSGSSLSLTSLTLTNFKALLVVFDGVSSTSTSAQLGLGSVIVISDTLGTATRLWDGTHLISLAGNGISTVNTSLWAAARASWVSSFSRSLASGLTTASTSITYYVSAGTFDAGEIKVYGIR